MNVFPKVNEEILRYANIEKYYAMYDLVQGTKVWQKSI